MAEAAETDDLIHAVKMAATAVTAAVLTAAIVIGGGRQFAPALFASAALEQADGERPGVLRVSDR